MSKEIKITFWLVASLWVVHLLDLILPIDLRGYGLIPRTTSGLPGIIFMPFLHGNWSHLIGNTIPLTILLLILCGTRSHPLKTVFCISLLTGLLLWCFGRSAVHIGASGVVYGLVGYLIAIGFAERRLIPVFVSLLVGFMYGTTLFFGLLPTAGRAISWDGHLCGAIAGCIVAVVVVKLNRFNDSEFDPVLLENNKASI